MLLDSSFRWNDIGGWLGWCGVIAVWWVEIGTTRAARCLARNDGRGGVGVRHWFASWTAGTRRFLCHVRPLSDLTVRNIAP